MNFEDLPGRSHVTKYVYRLPDSTSAAPPTIITPCDITNHLISSDKGASINYITL